MFSPRKNAVICLALGSTLLFTSCSSKLVKSVSALNSLRQHLNQKYHDNVAVNLHESRSLTVAFINSPLNNQDRQKRAERAQDAARFIAMNYQDIKSVGQIWISFVASETRFIVFHYSHGIDVFGFDRNGAPIGSETVLDDIAESDKGDLRTPIARFNAQTNQTDISITRLQLEGNMNRGVAMVPHFTVSGDARHSASLIPPEWVVLDFASYSNKPVFTGNASLEIHCDDRLALKGAAQLIPSTESGTDQVVGQFLSVRISFKLFQRMATSRNVRITLGPKRFELLPDDINALARMSAYVQTESGEPAQ